MDHLFNQYITYLYAYIYAIYYIYCTNFGSNYRKTTGFMPEGVNLIKVLHISKDNYVNTP